LEHKPPDLKDQPTLPFTRRRERAIPGAHTKRETVVYLTSRDPKAMAENFLLRQDLRSIIILGNRIRTITDDEREREPL